MLGVVGSYDVPTVDKARTHVNREVAKFMGVIRGVGNFTFRHSIWDPKIIQGEWGSLVRLGG